MLRGTLTASCYEDPQQILKIEDVVRKLLLASLNRRNVRLTIRNRVTQNISGAEGLYRGCTWCLTDRGLACVLRFAPAGAEDDAPIDVSQIEQIDTV